MNDIKLLKQQQKEAHPAFGSYLECMTRALFTGVATFALGFSTPYVTQTLLQKYLPYQKKYFILISGIIGSVISFQVTAQHTKACQAAWMAAEDKHTFLTETDN